MSGVNDDCYIHYYIQQQNASIAQSETSCLPLHRSQHNGGQLTQFTQGRSKVRRSCQSTIVGGACTELHHSERNFRTAWLEKGDFKIGILKKHWVDIYVQTTWKVNFASDDPFKNRLFIMSKDSQNSLKLIGEWITYPLSQLISSESLLNKLTSSLKSHFDSKSDSKWTRAITVIYYLVRLT